MARKCDITGKGPAHGNRVSHSNRKSRTVRRANIQKRRVYVPELGRRVTLKLSTQAIRTLDKKGMTRFLADQGLTLKDIA